MAYIVRMPKMGVEMQTGILLDWHVDKGDAVEEDDVLAEIESEKTTAEVAARESGVLRSKVLEAGVEIPPGTAMGVVAGAEASIEDLLAEIEAEGGDIETDAEPDNAATTTADGAEQSTAEGFGQSPTTERSTAGHIDEEGRATPKARRQASEAGRSLSGITGSGPKGAVTEDDVAATLGEGPATNATMGTVEPASATPELVTPRARKRASELGVDLAEVAGTDPHSSVQAADVESAEPVTATGTPTATGGGDDSTRPGEGERTVVEERALGGMRSTIAQRLSQSWDAPHVTVDRRVDAEALLLAGAESDDVISITDVLLKAVSHTLAEYPAFNATFEDDAHRIFEEHNVGVAVDIDSGLVTPVVRDIGSKSIAEIAFERGSLTERVRSGRQRPEDLQGGTFTVSNLGAFGVDSFTPIINPPEVAILGVNAIREDPHRTETGIEFRQTIGFSLSFDHRVVDGADAARFLGTLADCLEDATDLV
ncbi:2-oxo acid dehydrogenase subunit E2 [Halococcus salifodinae]|uniref:Branched-chain alpha-keto acid dehydrogenase subunit E2 n=1 Tax=Halococcus salifodinae DSM 8989 TaxID=1227456 RepID=M0NAC5_9EURY|nr:2-oxo acid dehydrogenase subunit E2 [Halococcus salifodinae]EMA54841.1 branched-chain alpha-keto acid dehydrogenase subunit E2 [Halococcus salifodinae DSM 8989]